MTNFLTETNFDFEDKTVLVRIDCDVDLCEDETCDQKKVDAEFRLQAMLPTIHFLQRKKIKKMILVGHMGRPGGQTDPKLSLAPIAQWFSKNFKECSLITNYQLPITNYLSLLENLRFDPGEKKNDQKFAKNLASLADVYINEAFATAHREHASLVGIPKYLPSFLGLRMEGEIKTLSSIKEKAKRPLVFVLGGSKPGKLDYLDFLANWADKLLIGGKHPQEKSMVNGQWSNVNWAELKSNGRDIDKESIKQFKQEINQAKTIIWAGPMGVYEEEENRQGTVEIARAIAQSKAFKLAGGGDTHTILTWLDLWDNFDFISTGGGALLQFLEKGSLPAIRAITKN